MPPANRIAITIDAIDGFSKKFEAINKRIAAITAPVGRLQKSFGRLSDAAGITKLAKGFEDLGRGSLTAFRNIARVVDPLAAITGAASIAGMIKLVDTFASFGSQLDFTAKRMGMSASALQTWQGAATLAGASANAMASGLQTLGTNLWNAIGGRAPEVTATMRQLGFSMAQIAAGAKDPAVLMGQLADKIAAIKSPFGQAAVATALFGSAGVELLPFLRDGAAGMADLTAKAKSYGVVTVAGIAAAQSLRYANANLMLSVQGLGNSIAEKLAPVLSPLILQMATWIAQNRAWIASGIGDAVRKFATWIKSVNWPAIGAGIAAVGASISGVVTGLGGWGHVATGLLLFIGGTWLAGMLAPFAAIALAVAGITASIGALPLLAIAASAAAVAALALLIPKREGSGPGGSYYVQNGHPVWIPTTSTIPENAPGHWGKIGGRNQYIQGGGASAQAGVRAQGMAYFMSQGWTKAQAAGLMGNSQAESQFDPNAVSPDGGAHGLFQDRGTRWAALVAKYGPNPTALQQFKFAQSELMGSESGAAAALRASSNPMDAGIAVDQTFERSGDSYEQSQRRGANANYIASLPSGPAANIGDGSAGGGAGGTQPTVAITVDHKNAPHGTTLSVKSSSPSVRVKSVKISHAMVGHA